MTDANEDVSPFGPDDVEIASAKEMLTEYLQRLLIMDMETEEEVENPMAVASAIQMAQADAISNALIGIKYEIELLNKSMRQFMHQWLRYSARR